MTTAPLEDHIRELEERLLDPAVRRSRRDVDDLLADEFVEFAVDGRAYTKAHVIDALGHETACNRSLRSFRLFVIAEDAVLATFRVTRRSEASSEPVGSLRSSVWILRAGRWRLAFHQGTLVPA